VSVQCQGRVYGRQCQRPATRGEWCWQHHPPSKAKRSHASAERPTQQHMDHVSAEMERSYVAECDGTCDPKCATCRNHDIDVSRDIAWSESGMLDVELAPILAPGSRKRAKFTASTTTDAKRLARGEHWKMVQAHFRRETRQHHPQIRVLTLAGGNPREEIECIRSLLHHAQIVAVDIDPQCCDAAKDAGADVVLCTDLFAWDHANVPAAIRELGTIDVVNLDLCGGITPPVERAVTYYGRLVRTAGVLMVSFSYGRDIVEVFSREPWQGIPAPLAGRVKRLHERIPAKDKTIWKGDLPAGTERIATLGLTSVIAYKGAQMPMCACLWEGHCNPEHPSFVNATDDDLMSATLAQLEPLDVSRLYALPAERIQHFRRKFAAAKAVSTRNARRGSATLHAEEADP